MRPTAQHRLHYCIEPAEQDLMARRRARPRHPSSKATGTRARQRLAVGSIFTVALGCVGCSQEPLPRFRDNEEAQRGVPDAAWMPPSADAGRGGDTSKTGVGTARVDAGSATDAATTRANDDDAGSDTATLDPRDAGTPTGAVGQPTVRTDAGAAQAPDASGTADASVTPDAATAESGCVPGFYAGAFSGAMRLAGITVARVTGTVSAQLTLDPQSQFLSIDNGQVLGADQDRNPVLANIAGRIRCDTYQLEDGRLEDGSYFSNNVGRITFTGTLQGDYAPDTSNILGMWDVQTTSNSRVTGSGDWTLLLGRPDSSMQ